MDNLFLQHMNSNKNRVLLLYPSSGNQDANMLPLSLLYVAQPLLQAGISVEIIDQRIERDFFNLLKNRLGPDLLCTGISCITGPHVTEVARIGRFIKEKTAAPVVLGGPHPTILPEQTLQSEFIDYVVLGKGEGPFLSLAKALQDGRPVNDTGQIGYKTASGIVVNRHAAEEIAVSDIPYHLLSRYGRPFVIPVITSYGCPHRCAFCLERVLHPRYYEIPLESVLAVIERALTFKPRLVNFIDDNFLCNRKRVVKLFSMCGERGLRFSSLCTGRVDEVLRMDDETLDFLMASGLESIYFGVESGSERILELVNKRITPDMVLTLNKRLARQGITPHYSFMSGFPTETKEDLDKTIALMERLKKENPKAVFWKINTYTPYPGTELYDLAVECGFKPPQRFEDWADVYFYSSEFNAGYNAKL